MGLRRFFWRIVDGCDYWVTLTRLRILGVLAGSELETPADLQRRHDQQRIERAFSKIEPRGVGSAVAIRADHLRPHCQIAQNGSGDRRGGGRRLGRRALRTGNLGDPEQFNALGLLTFVLQAVAGKRISGTYTGAVQLASGKFAIIEKSRVFTLVPWRPVIEKVLGRQVSGLVQGGGISWELGRQRALGIGI